MATFELTDGQVTDIIDSINDRLERLEILEEVADDEGNGGDVEYFRETTRDLEAIKDILDPAGLRLREMNRG